MRLQAGELAAGTRDRAPYSAKANGTRGVTRLISHNTFGSGSWNQPLGGRHLGELADLDAYRLLQAPGAAGPDAHVVVTDLGAQRGDRALLPGAVLERVERVPSHGVLVGDLV